MLKTDEHSPVKCALFDFDGTLAQSDEYMIAAVNALLRARKRPPFKDAPPPGGVGALLTCAGFAEHELPDAKRELWEHYEATNYRETKLFPGAAELLSDLERSGWRWGVVTNKPGRYFWPIIENLGWKENPALVTRETPGAEKKPGPGGLLLAARLCGAAVGRCAYVGDELQDARAAHAAGMPFIRAAWRPGGWEPSPEGRAALVAATARTPAEVLPLAEALIASGD